MAEKLTKSLIDSLPLVETGQVTVMDTITPGFGIRVGAKSKTFIVVKRLPHKTPQRVTLGRYGALTVETARKAAIEALGKLSGGVDC
ncbi:MAG: Arm DNA-binding domain-containing protein [Pseudomonadota bacterium]